MKIDPYNHKERYLKWKEKVASGIPDISLENSKLIMQYIQDMEAGINIASGSIKGRRSYLRLNALKDRLIWVAKSFKKLYGLDNIISVSEEQILTFFSDIQAGIIKNNRGTAYKGVDTYINIFKAFWHWHQKSNRKKGIEIKDITTDLDTTREKPEWVYLTEDQVKTLCDNAKYEYKVLIWFLFDTGIRSPTELMNIRVSDLYCDCKELNIREEVSKTFGRRIKLMLCSNLLKEFIKNKGLKPEEFIFQISPVVANRYLQRIAKRIFGDVESPAGEKYSNLTMYDFRHNACCYWLPRYKSESALKYRFGWKKSEKIHYYSELLGMKDTINEEDMLVDVTKTEIEKRLEKSEKEKEMLQERLVGMETQMSKILELMNVASNKVQMIEIRNKS